MTKTTHWSDVVKWIPLCNLMSYAVIDTSFKSNQKRTGEQFIWRCWWRHTCEWQHKKSQEQGTPFLWHILIWFQVFVDPYFSAIDYTFHLIGFFFFFREIQFLHVVINFPITHSIKLSPVIFSDFLWCEIESNPVKWTQIFSWFSLWIAKFYKKNHSVRFIFGRNQ
jgi:hypothetical protein